MAHLEAVRREAEEEEQRVQQVLQRQASAEHKTASSPKHSSSFNVASDIANEEVYEGVALNSDPALAAAAPTSRNSSWKSDKVPFVRRSEQAAAKLTTLDSNLIPESAELIALVSPTTLNF